MWQAFIQVRFSLYTPVVQWGPQEGNRISGFYFCVIKMVKVPVYHHSPSGSAFLTAVNQTSEQSWLKEGMVSFGSQFGWYNLSLQGSHDGGKFLNTMTGGCLLKSLQLRTGEEESAHRILLSLPLFSLWPQTMKQCLSPSANHPWSALTDLPRGVPHWFCVSLNPVRC